MHFAEAGREDQLMPAFDALTKQGVGALIVAPDPFFDMVGVQLVTMAAERRWPALYHQREYTVAGGLMSYGVNFGDVYRTMGTYAERFSRSGAGRPAGERVDQDRSSICSICDRARALRPRARPPD